MLTSPSNQRVKRVVALRSRRRRDREGRFVVEGARELAFAADADFPVEEVFFCRALFADRGEEDVLARYESRGVECQPTDRIVFAKLSYRDTPDGLLAVAATPEWNLQDLRVPDRSLWLVAAGIEKPGNLGAMLRSADAAGASGVLVADPGTDVSNPNVVRASVGTLFSVPVAVATAAEIRAWLGARDTRMVVARPDADVDYTSADLRGPLAIVVGSEHRGLDASWSAPECGAVRIPMAGRADSVNAAVAAALLLFEARRQRWV